MPGQEDLISTPNTCQSCGAGLHNSYTHDADCLMNLPGSYEELSRFWNGGWNAFLKHGPNSEAAASKNPDDITAKVFLMGFRCAEKMSLTVEAGKISPRNVIALHRPSTSMWQPEG
jgi:hypothetical protein